MLVPLLVELLFIGTLSLLLVRAEEERGVERTNRIAGGLATRVFGDISLAPYLLALSVYTSSEKLNRLFKRQIIQVRASQKDLADYVAEHPEIAPNLNLEGSTRMVNAMTDMLIKAEETASEPGIDRQTLIFNLERTFFRAQEYVGTDLSKGFEHGDRIALAAQRDFEQTRQFQYMVVISGIVFNVLIALCLAFFYKRSILDRIKTIARNTDALSGKGWLSPEMGGKDEIAQLDHAFHQMYKSLLKASELEKALFNNASDVICVLDAQNRFIRINPAGERLWGYQIEVLNKLTLNSLVVPEDQTALSEIIESTKESAKANSFEGRIKSRKEKTLFGLWSIYWSEETQNLFCIFHDITEHRIVEQERKNFLAMISSDLQKPLLRISNEVESLVSGVRSGLPEKAREKLSMAERNLKRLLALVKELIQVTEMESGTLELRQQQIPVRSLLEQAVSEIQALAEAKNITLKTQFDDASVFADGDKILQVLLNLLSNAVKFSPENSTIILSADESAGAGAERLFKVQDSGRGIPDKQLDSVFEKFKQVETADAKRKSGTGLGLPICKQLIEQHAGRIGVSSEIGKGSTFWFTLPKDERSFAESSKRQKKQLNHPALNSEQTQKTSVAVRKAELTKQEKSTDNKSKVRVPLLWQGAILIGLPLIFELVFGVGLFLSLSKVQSQRNQELEMRKIAYMASKGLRTLSNVGSCLMRSGKNKATIDEYQKQEADWDAIYDELSTLMAGDPSFTEVKEKTDTAVARIRKFRNQIGGPAHASTVMGVAASLMTITKNLKAIAEIAQDHEFVDPVQERKWRNEQNQILITGLAVNTILSILMAIYFAFGISRRLVIMADNTRRLTKEEDLNRPVGGIDELTELDRAFHKAAESLLDSRRRERAVFDNSKDVLCVLAKNGTFQSINPAAEQSWGFKRSDLLTLSLSQLIDKDDLHLLTDLISAAPDKAFEQSVDVRMITGELYPEGTKTIWTRWTISRSKGMANSFCVVRDISSMKQLEQLRKEFLAVVSHDLRTPLTGIMGIANLVGANAFGTVGGDALQSIRTIERYSDMLLELINDILDLEKLEAGQMQLDLRPTDMQEISERLLIQVKNLPAQFQSRCIGDRLGQPFPIDADRILQAMNNLMKYLVYRNPRPALIRFQINQVVQGVEFQIFDQGPPISPTVKDSIFLRLKDQSLNEPMTESSFHAELSMPLAWQIINSHKGSISIETNSANGSNVVTIRLPDPQLTARSIAAK